MYLMSSYRPNQKKRYGMGGGIETLANMCFIHSSDSSGRRHFTTALSMAGIANGPTSRGVQGGG